MNNKPQFIPSRDLTLELINYYNAIEEEARDVNEVIEETREIVGTRVFGMVANLCHRIAAQNKKEDVWADSNGFTEEIKDELEYRLSLEEMPKSGKEQFYSRLYEELTVYLQTGQLGSDRSGYLRNKEGKLCLESKVEPKPEPEPVEKIPVIRGWVDENGQIRIVG